MSTPNSPESFLESKVPDQVEFDRRSVAIIGGGIAGLSAACSLADAGFRVTVFERRGYLGGRASSYLHPGTGEIIDNCQHVLFGCCTNLVAFYERIGVASKIFWDSRMTLIEPGGRRSILQPFRLPAPMHGLPAILKADCFSWKDKLALIGAFTSMMLMHNPDGTQNLSEWLAAHRQTPGALDRFWRLVIASALNADLDHIGLDYAVKVIRELFLNSPQAGSMGMSTVPLSQLLKPSEDYLRERGGQIFLNTNLESATWDCAEDRWNLASKLGSYQAANLILALPFEATAKLIPNFPANPAVDKLERQLASLEHWPICSVHLWFDRKVTELDHAVLLDRDIHWMYHKSNWQPSRNPAASYIELVVSASREFATLSREQAIAQSVQQLGEFFPVVRQAKLIKSALIKEVRATFGVPPGVDDSRAHAQSPWPNCFLAGDWTATGWPSTMESAARSGALAAEALVCRHGENRRFLVPDLHSTGLMKLSDLCATIR